MDSQKNNLHHQNLNNSIKLKKESSTQTLITSIQLNKISNEKNLMSNEDYFNFFFGKEPGFLKLEKIDKSLIKTATMKRKRRENSKKKIENNALKLFQEEYKKTNPNLSNEEFIKNTKEKWKQMSSSLRNIYFSNIEDKNTKEN